MTTTVTDPNGCIETVLTQRVVLVKNGVETPAFLIEGFSDCNAIPLVVSCPCGLLKLAPLQAVETQCVNGNATYTVTVSNLPFVPLAVPFLQNFLRSTGKGKKCWKRSSRS